ncbi:MAG: cytochrome c oxidase subunit 3 [Rhodocyclaceae bacterium]
MSQTVEKYFVPEPSRYPIFGSVALLLLGSGAAMWMNKVDHGPAIVALGFAVLLYMLFGWFGQVIHESQSGKYGKQVDRAFRWSMGWFIFSEVMFFAAFFGVLFYVRVISVPDLGTDLQHLFWPGYEAAWPTAGPFNKDEEFLQMGWFGLPLINTALLVTSAVTLTIAHWGIKKNAHGQTNFFLALTILLGAIFLGCQAYEYHHAYAEGLKLTTGVYGSTFFMMTGFHGLHVTIGAIMLTVMLVRSLRGHFTAEHHFAFEAAAWYWHFVDYVWLLLFVVVYIL